MNIPSLVRRCLPILDWGVQYNGKTSTDDLIVAGIITVMLIPKSLICRFLEESE